MASASDDAVSDHVHSFDSNTSLSRRLDRFDRVIQNESGDSIGDNVYYVTIQITFITRKFRNEQRNLHCDVLHITTDRDDRLVLDCNGVFAIKAYGGGNITREWAFAKPRTRPVLIKRLKKAMWAFCVA